MTLQSNTNSKKINVLFAAAEADPLIKVGGLGDVAGSLPSALRSLHQEDIHGFSIDVRLAIPFHFAIQKKIPKRKPLVHFSVAHIKGPIPGEAYYIELNNLPTYLIDGPPISANPDIYSNNPQVEGEKYIFFSRAILEMTRALNWKPNVFHANDWHTSAAVYSLHKDKNHASFFSKTRSVLTVHNLPFMGTGIEEVLNVYLLPPYQENKLPEWACQIPLPLGLISADKIITVSPTYAKEILTPQFGCGMEDTLRSRQDDITGILNGLDNLKWDPSIDSDLIANYDFHDLSPRRKNKEALLSKFSLKPDINIPLLIMIGRMDQQKGVDLAIESLRQISNLPWQAILLGTGDPALEESCRQLESDLPDKVRAVISFDTQLAHRMYSGADILLMPSRYEPCGLAQMIAMRYGCIPIARATGGLKDTIRDYHNTSQDTGFLFREASANALILTLQRALSLYQNRQKWEGLQNSGMQQDFSWQRSAQSYAEIYLDLIEERL